MQVSIGKAIEKRWILGGIAVYVISVGLLYLLMLRPMAARVEGAKDEKSRMENYHILLEAREAIEAFEQRLTADSTEDEIRSLAEECGVQLEAVVPDTVRPVDRRLYSVSFRMLFRSVYHQIGSFLARLEGTDAFLAVDDLSITAASNRDEGHLTECIVYAFRKKE